jgi:hypothetical protein
MIAYHGQDAIKAQYLARVETRRLADEILQGIGRREGRGGAASLAINSNDYREYETQLGIPKALADLEDHIFEELSQIEAKEFPSAFLKAIPVAADLSLVCYKFVLWLLIDPQHGVITFTTSERLLNATEWVAKLYERAIAGAMPPLDEWRATRDIVHKAFSSDHNYHYHTVYSAADIENTRGYSSVGQMLKTAVLAACAADYNTSNMAEGDSINFADAAYDSSFTTIVDAEAYELSGVAFKACEDYAFLAHATREGHARDARDKLLDLLHNAPIKGYT